MQTRTRLLSGSLLVAAVSLQLPITAFAGTEDPTTTEMTARLAELKTPEESLPQTEFLIYAEILRLQDELGKYQRYLATITRPDESGKRLQEIKAEAAIVIKQARDLDCKTSKQADVDALFAKVARIRSRLFRLDDFDDDSPWDSISTRLAPNESREQLCERLKQTLAKEGELMSYFEKKQRDIENQDKVVANDKQLATTIVEKLQLRKNALQTKAASLTSQASVAKDLWLIICLMCGFSILTMLAIWLFSEEIQKHWVESGQVIQFVTVMILLSVIMALGMSGILKENTLGTLLGGLAGYVLSQGVGRATAQAITRSIAVATAKPVSITSVTPDNAVSAGGTSVTISGLGFVKGATVTFGGTAANITSLNDKVILAIAPPHNAGVVDIVVTNPDGNVSKLPSGFTFT